MSKISGDHERDIPFADSVVPRSGLSVNLPPGVKAPRSGIYERVGPRGGHTGEQPDSTRGKPLPPTDHGGKVWRLITPAHHSGKK